MYMCKMKYVYPCVVRGFHVYKVYWDPVIGESLDTEPDSDGEKFGDMHCVAVKKGNMTVGHVPKDISLLAKYFIIHGGSITCKITGKRQRSKMLRGGLEVPCKYIFTIEGKAAVIRRLKDKLNSVAKTW